MLLKRVVTWFVVCAILGGCAAMSANVKPLPAGAKACASDWDCSDDQWCGFPGAGTHAQCLPGHGDERWDTTPPTN